MCFCGHVWEHMLDASLPLTSGRYEEWGNPTERRTTHAEVSPYDIWKKTTIRYFGEYFSSTIAGDVLGAGQVRGHIGFSNSSFLIVFQRPHIATYLVRLHTSPGYR